MFELVPEAENVDDPCIKYMCEGTDEAKKVIRREGKIWHAVFKKRDVSKKAELERVQTEFMTKFYE